MVQTKVSNKKTEIEIMQSQNKNNTQDVITLLCPCNEG